MARLARGTLADAYEDYLERVDNARAADAALYAAIHRYSKASPRLSQHADDVLAALNAGAAIDAPRIESGYIARIAVESGRPEIIEAMKRSVPSMEAYVDERHRFYQALIKKQS